MPEPLNPNRGNTFGPYRVLAELGRGGMGVVYMAEEIALKRRVALKVMLPTAAADAQAKARFLREAEAQAQVEHDHIIAIYRVDNVGGTPYIAMPLLRGQTLGSALRLMPRPPLAEVIRIAREIAEGLAAAHRAGLIHRDIKPGNVWLEGDKRRVKILDFGLARVGHEAPASGELTQGAILPTRHDGTQLTATGAMMGTPAYMSPEQARVRPVDHRADLWSLGVVLYQMTTGKMPFTGPSTLDLLTAVVSVEPPSVAELTPDAPPALAALIHKLLAKNPARRPVSAQAVADELAAVERNLAVLPFVVTPLSEGPGAPNPWADIDTAVVDPPAGADSPPAEVAPAPPVRIPRWSWLVALAALVVVAAVALAVRYRKERVPKPDAQADASEKEPEKKVDDGKKKVEKLSPPPSQREVAEWVLKQKMGRNGGTHVYILRPNAPKSEGVHDLAALPDGPFTVVGVVMYALQREHAADVPKMFAALGNLELLQFTGPGWADDDIAAAVAAVTKKSVKTLEIWDIPGPLPSTSTRLQYLGAIEKLQVSSKAYDGVYIDGIAQAKGVKVLRLGDDLSDTALASFAGWPNWPTSLDLSGNPRLGDKGIEHIRPKFADRVNTTMTVNLIGTAVTEAGVTALCERLPNVKATWTKDGKAVTVGPMRAVWLARQRTAAQAILDRGGAINLKPTGATKRGDDVTDTSTFDAVLVATGPYFETSGGKVGSWDTPKTGTAKPLGDTDLATLRVIRPDILKLHGQNLTDAAMAEFVAAGVGRGLYVTNCDVGDETARAAATQAHLLHLNLANTKLTNAGVKAFVGKLPELKTLLVGGTDLTDDAVPALAALPWLVQLDLKGTKITAGGAERLAAALPYTWIRHAETVFQPTRTQPTRDAALDELYARGARFSVGGTSNVPPEKFAPNLVGLSCVSGPVRGWATVATGWDGKEVVTGTVLKPFDAAELVALATAARIQDFRWIALVGQNVGDTGVAALFALPAARTIEDVALANCGVGDGAVEHVSRLPLHSLYLSNTKVTAAGVRLIAEQKPLLGKLRLNDCPVDNSAVPYLTKLKALYELDLNKTHITKDRWPELIAALPYTYVRLPNGEEKSPVRPRGYHLGDRATAIKVFLERGASLRNGGAAVTDPAKFVALANPGPMYVVLRTSPYHDPAQPANGWESLREDPREVTNPFDDADLLALVPDLRLNAIQFMALNRQKVTDAGIAGLATMPALRALTTLELIDCDVGDASAASLATLPKLKDLYLNRTKVTNAGVKALLPRAAELETLCLVNTQVNDGAITDLIQFKRLQRLDLNGTAVTPDGATRLQAALPNCAIRDGTGKEYLPPKK